MLRRTPAFLAIMAVASVAIAEDQQTVPRAPAAPRAQNQREAAPAARESEKPLQTRQQRTANFRGAAQGEETVDSAVADCLILSNKEEIALLKFGMEKTQNEQVKQLAEKMIQDHEQAIQSLSKFAMRAKNVEFQASSSLPRGESVATTREARRVGTEQPSATQNNATPAATPRNEIADRGAAGTDVAAADDSMGARMFKIEHEAAQNCLQMIEQDLTKHEGHHFDAAFLGYQTGMHVGMLARLKAIQDNVSGELAQVVQQSEQVTMQHKQHVEQLMEQIAHQKSDEQGANKGDSSTKTRIETPQRTPVNQ